jgi:MFS family permease
MTALRHIASLIAAMTILQLASGLLTVQLPLTMRADGLREFAIGLIGAAYSAGFMAGAWYGPRILSRVGHIRAYSAAASLCAAATLFANWADHEIAWALLRALTGAAVAVMFAGVESWLSGLIKAEERGGVLGFYMVITKAALAVGPFLAPIAQPQGALVLAGALLALSLTPIALTSQPAPPLPEPEPPRFKDLMDTAPAAVVAAFAAGVTNAGVLAIAPLYASSHWGEGAATPFVASAIVGSLLLQWPAAKLSDRMDRRIVIAMLAVIAALPALALAFAGEALALPAAAVLFALWGAGALSFYGIAVAHMADRAAPAALTRATSGLLFVWAAGAIAGPPLMGLAAEIGGGAGLFFFASLGAFACAGYMFVRRKSRQAAAERRGDGASADQATSVAAADLAYARKQGASPKNPPVAPDAPAAPTP